MNEAEALALLDARGRFGQRLGLETMRGMLRAMGNFHEGLRVIHVGGTNGKGSVSAMVAAALAACGHRTGLYTSPHLVRFHERIRVDGVDVSGDELARAMDALRPALEAHPHATYFEVGTLVALWHFVQQGVDVAVLEVGLGGRLDATNVFDAPLATVVTNVSLEHTETLGTTLEAIAREKGGIVKPGVPLVTGATGGALAVLVEIARERGSPIRRLGDDFVPIPGEPDAQGQSLEVAGLREWGAVHIPFHGEHQAENAALALAALDAVDARGLAVPVKNASEGLARTRWPGRLQRIPGRPAILLDGAHNPAGMRTLADHLARTGEKPVLVFGSLADKDWAAMLESILPQVRDVIVTRVPSPRAVDPTEPARLVSQLGLFGLVVEDVGHALRTAEGIAGEDGLVLVTGSLHLVGDVLGRLER